jgi:DNA primase
MQPFRFTKEDEEKNNRWKIYKKIMEKYVNFCHKELISQKYPEVTEYLKKRKITKAEVNFFQIGYATIKNNFYDKLKEEFDEKQIISSGIYYLDEKKNIYVDRFRGRIIFPVQSLDDSILALGGRALSQKTFAKYINSPETEFYKKGNHLYNINSARNFKDSAEEVFIVEGYMDVINLHKFGIKNVVANLGTAITERQIYLTSNYFKNLTICLDGDSSGRKAALRAAERLFPLIKPDFNINFLTLPENLDPDAYINQEGKESFLKFTESKIKIQDFIWKSYYNDVDKNDPYALSLFEKKIKGLCADMQDKILAKYFLNIFVKKINDLTPNLNFKKNKFFKYKKPSAPLQQTKDVNNQRNKFEEQELKEFSILFLIINNPDIFRKNIELISKVSFNNNLLLQFKDKLVDFLVAEEFFDKKKITNSDFGEKFNKTIDLINANAPVKIIVNNKNEEEIVIMFNEIIDEIKKINLRTKIEFLEDKVSINLDENLYSELLSLRTQLKEG